ncbi:hypothetical protein [Bacillus sp. J33]|uniref:hypothetical protein n=1 Tax=Bacillus sp. J33 TaxID=935836 RepID=UPI00047B8DB7|nr:hypothetical protein [Bacillus sp. J33]
MKYFIALFCSDKQCKNRSVTRVLEAISSEAAREAVYELNFNGKDELCPCCKKRMNYYLDFQHEHEQSLLL